MKNRTTQFASLPALSATAALFLWSNVTADVTINWVPIGNPGNAKDTTGYGAVPNTYRIGKYEVTNAQYTEFLNKVDPTGSNPNEIYNASMGSNANGGISFSAEAANGEKYSVKANMGNKPVNFLSWYDAARFANWMNNGQGTGSTETGAYTLTGNTGMLTRNPDAKIWLPSEDEWYKAAYYDPTKGGTGGYWMYPTRSDSKPTPATATATGDVGNPGTNVVNVGYANWKGNSTGLPTKLTTVGSAGAGSASYYGTFDQGGNLSEWNETARNDETGKSVARIYRGGAYSTSSGDMRATQSDIFSPSFEIHFIGFRLAGVPEQ